MKGLIILLVAAGGAGIAYALSAKKGTNAQRTVQEKGATPTPAYNPRANVWSNDQPANSGTRNPVSPIMGKLPTGGPQPSGLCSFFPNTPLLGCAPAAPPAPNAADSSTNDALYAAAETGTVVPPVGTSPTFWAADKVPTNPALQVPTSSFDANNYLDFNWFDQVPTAKTTPVNQV